jgi:hypothetical protein
VEKILPYPYVIEEVVKIFFVLLILGLPGKIFQLKLAVFIAFLFAFSESFFYLSNFTEAGNAVGFIQRFFLVGFFHILTMLIILIPAQKKSWLIIPALFIVICLHYFFNQSVPLFFH